MIRRVRGARYARDVTWRGALLSQAGIEAVWHVPCGGFPYGDESLVYIANDWHTAILPVYLRAFYQAGRAPKSSITPPPPRLRVVNFSFLRFSSR